MKRNESGWHFEPLQQPGCRLNAMLPGVYTADNVPSPIGGSMTAMQPCALTQELAQGDYIVVTIASNLAHLNAVGIA